MQDVSRKPRRFLAVGVGSLVVGLGVLARLFMLPGEPYRQWATQSLYSPRARVRESNGLSPWQNPV